MDRYAHALRDTPRALTAELARYGGLNPHGQPNWRVVLAANVLEQSFGVMRHMPLVTADSDVTDIEPEKVEAGEFWTPRYQQNGWILERWFPPTTWGSPLDWRLATAQDGVTRMMGEWPRHGDWWMVSEEFLPHCPPAAFWKAEIQRELKRMAALPGDPSRVLSERLYTARVAEERRRERYLEEVNYVHRGVVEQVTATVGARAQRVRDAAAADAGLSGNLAAG